MDSTELWILVNWSWALLHVIRMWLFQTQNNFPWICPLFIYYWLFQTLLHVFPTIFLFFLRVQNTMVQFFKSSAKSSENNFKHSF